MSSTITDQSANRVSSTMNGDLSAQTDSHLITAGECFMFLSWVQSAMCDLLALEALSPESRARYNAAPAANASWPQDFSTNRLTLSKESFGALKGRFLDKWPQWRTHNVHVSIERVVLLRNAIGHAQVQPLRPYLLYVPEDGRWGALEQYFTCGRCHLPLNACTCEHGSPKSLRLPCQEPWFLESLYGTSDPSTRSVFYRRRCCWVLHIRDAPGPPRTGTTQSLAIVHSSRPRVRGLGEALREFRLTRGAVTGLH